MKEYNYVYCGLSIVVRNNKGVVRRKKEVLKECDGESNEEIKFRLESFVDGYRVPSFYEIGGDRNVLKGLSQIDPAFGEKIVEQLINYERLWGELAYVRFGLMGMIAEGKPGKPNYQIESEDAKKKVAFYHSHKEFDVTKFDEGNISDRFSLEKVKKLWCID